MELDHEKLESKEQTNNPQKKGQKVNQRACWTKVFRKYLYANLENIREKGIWLTNAKLIVEAFSEIDWNFKTRHFQEFNEVDPYALLYSDTQREVWQKACSLREKPKKPKTLPEPPAEVLRREWQKALVDIANDYEQKRKASAKHNPIDYKKVVMNAFKRIAWNVPKQAFDCLQPTYTMSIKEIMDPTYQRHFWYAGCKAMNKTRDFYLTTGRDQLMSPDYQLMLPDFEQEIQNILVISASSNFVIMYEKYKKRLFNQLDIRKSKHSCY